MRALRFARIERQVGGVRFEGSLADARRANLELRTAVRVLWRQSRFSALDTDALYAGASAIDWSRFLGPDGSLRVDAQSSESVLEHTLFVEQRVKDAVVDQLRARHGRRPAVDKDVPDLPIHVHLFRDRCTISVDTSGDSLHLRGWRKFQGRAPLAETLAAGLVLASGWDRRAPLVDPFCGSGTIVIEAALLASGTAPGLFRERFAFERWPGHDAARWKAERDAARARIKKPTKLTLLGLDADRGALAGARENAIAAGVEEFVQFELGRAEAFAPKRGWNAWIVTNPPYGERIGDEGDLVKLHTGLGALFRDACRGYRVVVLSGNPRLVRALGLEPVRKLEVKNGGLDCTVSFFEP